MQGKTTPQGNLLRTLKATRLRRYALLLAVAVISLCLMAYDCGESAEVNFGYSYSSRMTIPQWTPEGNRILLVRWSTIYVVDADGSNLEVVNGDAGKQYRDAHSPSPSPDGSQVVYSQRLKSGGLIGGRLSYELVLSDIDGSNDRRLTEDVANYVTPAWSPDGSRIAFLSDRLSLEDLSDDLYLTDFTLFTMAPDGTDIRSLAPGVLAIEQGAIPIWSPDGRKIAFLSEERLA